MVRVLCGLAAAFLVVGHAGAASAGSLRFFGNGTGDIDRVKIQVDDPASTLPGPPVDVGAADFTIEFWMKAAEADNPAPAVACGGNVDWIYGHVIIDRDRFNQDRKFGISLAGGTVVFGVSGDGTGDRTICGAANVLDNAWHHVAVQRARSSGVMSLHIDGVLQSQAAGPGGDISYPDNGVPGNYCGGPCSNSDPYLVFGAEKHDAGAAYPSFNGFLTNVRLSPVLRYAGDFTPPAAPFAADGDTAALYLFNEGAGTLLADTSGAAGGPSNGVLRVGGAPEGPVWSEESPFVGEAGSVVIYGPNRVVRGETALLAAQTEGISGSPAYAWALNGTPLTGEGEPTLVIENADEGDEGFYTVTVTDGGKAVHVSLPFFLQVVESVPAAGPAAVWALAGLLGALGVLRARRNRQKTASSRNGAP